MSEGCTACGHHPDQCEAFIMDMEKELDEACAKLDHHRRVAEERVDAVDRAEKAERNLADLRARAEKVRGVLELIVADLEAPTKCDCAAVDIGVGVMHEPFCGAPDPRSLAKDIRDALALLPGPTSEAPAGKADSAIDTDQGSAAAKQEPHLLARDELLALMDAPHGHHAACARVFRGTATEAVWTCVHQCAEKRAAEAARDRDELGNEIESIHAMLDAHLGIGHDDSPAESLSERVMDLCALLPEST